MERPDPWGSAELNCENGQMKSGLHNQCNLHFNSNDVLHRTTKPVSKFMWKQNNPE